MRACFSARRLLRSRSFSPQQTKPSLYRTHSSESVPLDLLSWGIRNHSSMKSETCQLAKGSSFSTCCGAGCYKHLSNLKWVCNTVMFPSRCYLPESGAGPCAQGVCTGWNTYTLSHSLTSAHTCTRAHTHTHTHTHTNTCPRVGKITTEGGEKKEVINRGKWGGEWGWGGAVSVPGPDKVSSLCPRALTAQTTLLASEAKGKGSEPSVNIDHLIST